MATYNFIDEYSDFKEIGFGLSSKVYAALHKKTGIEVALKEISKDILKTEKNKKNFTRELNIIKKLEHPYIIHCYSFFETEKSYIIVMEYAKKGTLLDRVNSGRKLSIDETRRVFSQVVSALYYLKSNNIIHRDIKLENIFFDEYNNVKLADFGFSYETNGKDEAATFCGTCPYIAPEILKKTPYTSAVDMWSLGICMYASSMGNLPFWDENVSKLFSKILNLDPFYPFTLPTVLVDLLKGLLNKDASQRFTVLNVIKHNFFANVDIIVDINNKDYRFIPRSVEDLNQDIVKEMLKLKMDISQCLVRNTKEQIFYLIKRNEQIKKISNSNGNIIKSNSSTPINLLKIHMAGSRLEKRKKVSASNNFQRQTKKMKLTIPKVPKSGKI